MFTISYSQEFMGEGEERAGMELGLESSTWGSFKGASGILNNTPVPGSGSRSYMSRERDLLMRSGSRFPSCQH